MERRFSDAEVAEILSAAAQSEQGGGKDGWTVGQLIAMAAEMGIDRSRVMAQIDASDLGPQALASSVETVPSQTRSYGAPRNILLRRRVRGAVSNLAIEDAAEDARRSLNRVSRLEVRKDELVVEGTYPGTQVTLYVESNPTHSCVSMNLDFRRFSTIVHCVVQGIALIFVWGNYVSSVSSASWFFTLLAFWMSIAFFVGSIVSNIVAKQGRARAEKDFALISHRLARSTSQATVTDRPSDQDSAAKAELSHNLSS